MAKNGLFGHLGSKTDFGYTSLIRHTLIDCNCLVFFDNMTWKIRLIKNRMHVSRVKPKFQINANFLSQTKSSNGF